MVVVVVVVVVVLVVVVELTKQIPQSINLFLEKDVAIELEVSHKMRRKAFHKIFFDASSCRHHSIHHIVLHQPTQGITNLTINELSI